ncbi:hypothetical protein SDC9_182964 [bioreactor metagenome]|uniref:Uncharacterized protein n=1 Tax=bioreactor metagenome TaxID=1076179 RepID=A0A645HAB2_9ZZZZ
MSIAANKAVIIGLVEPIKEELIAVVYFKQEKNKAWYKKVPPIPNNINGFQSLARGIQLSGCRLYKIAKINGMASKNRKKVSANAGNSRIASFPVMKAPDQKTAVNTIRAYT